MIITALLCLMALLLIPVNVSFNAGWHRKFPGDVRVRWLFGLVRLHMQPGSNGSDSESRKKQSRDDSAHDVKKKRPKEKKRKRSKSAHRTRRFIPLQLITLVIALMLSPTIWRALKDA